MRGDRSKQIKNKLTSRGLKNPRYMTALNEEKFSRLLLQDLKGMYTVLTKQQIKAQYTDTYITDLLQRGNANLRDLRGPTVRTMHDYARNLH